MGGVFVTDKKLHIIRTALRLFAQRGISHTPTSKIASEAGISNGTLFHYFPTKKAIIEETYIYCKEEMLAYVYVSYPPKESYEIYVKSIWRKILYWALDHYDEYRYMMHLLHSTYLTESIFKSSEQPYEALRKLFYEVMENHTFREMDSEYIQMTNTMFFAGAISYIKKNEIKRTEVDSIIDLTVERIWHSLVYEDSN